MLQRIDLDMLKKRYSVVVLKRGSVSFPTEVWHKPQ